MLQLTRYSIINLVVWSGIVDTESHSIGNTSYLKRDLALSDTKLWGCFCLLERFFARRVNGMENPLINFRYREFSHHPSILVLVGPVKNIPVRCEKVGNLFWCL